MSGNTDSRSVNGREPGDGELVRSAKRGDLGAFEKLVERYQRQVTAVSYRMLSNREDAMDVVQDSFLKAFDKLDTLTQPGRFGPWLMRIVSNLSLNYRRSRALRKTDTLDYPDDDLAHGRDSQADPSMPEPSAISRACCLMTLRASGEGMVRGRVASSDTRSGSVCHR